MRLSLTLTLSYITVGDLDTWLCSFSFGKRGSGVVANCSLCGIETILSFLPGQVCSSFSAKVCAILQALCWFRQHHQVNHFSFLLFSSLTLVLSSPLSFLFRDSKGGKKRQILPDLPLSSFTIRLQWILWRINMANKRKKNP